VIAILGALNYGALARRIPESGSEYLFLSHTLHPAAAWMCQNDVQSVRKIRLGWHSTRTAPGRPLE